jgi:hypothetical protein
MGHQPNRAHVLLLVPKRDELRAAAAVFGFSVDAPEALLGEYETWQLRLGELSLRVLLVGRAGKH